VNGRTEIKSFRQLTSLWKHVEFSTVEMYSYFQLTKFFLLCNCDVLSCTS